MLAGVSGGKIDAPLLHSHWQFWGKFHPMTLRGDLIFDTQAETAKARQHWASGRIYSCEMGFFAVSSG